VSENLLHNPQGPEGPPTFPFRYRCNLCRADHVIQVPRKQRAVDMKMWIEGMTRAVAAHHLQHHAGCPQAGKPGAEFDTLFPIEGQDEEALRKMEWPTLEEMQGRMRDVE
jgi:hypothetical protein